MIKTAAAASIAALLAACGSATSTPNANGTSPASTAPAATAGKFKACMVTDTGGIDDRSFNASSYQGLKDAAAANSNVSITYLPSASGSDYTPNINTFIAQKCGIIVTVGFLMGTATQTAAKANPNQKFAIVDYTYSPAVSNIDALVFNTLQDAFQGGYLAAGMTKTGTVATFGGQQFGTVTIYMDGFYDGVQYYNQRHGTHVKVLGWNEATQKGSFTGNFTDQTKGLTLTNTFINAGADIIFPVAGNVGLGAAKAVQTADQAGRKVNMFWVDTDGCVSAPQYCQYFITSVQKGIANAVKAAVLSAAGGTFKGGNYIGTLTNAGVGLAPFHDFASKVPASLKAELAQIATQLENGTLKPKTKSPA